LAPCFAPSALYLPQLVTYARRAGPIFLLATAVATTFLLLGAMRMWHFFAGRATRLVMPLTAALLGVLSVGLMGAAAFYAMLSTYPGLVVLTYVLTDPADSVDYARSNVTLFDALLLIAAVGTMIGLAVAVTRRVWSEPRRLHRAVFNILLGAAL